MGFGKFKFVLWTYGEFDNTLAKMKDFRKKYKCSYFICSREICPKTGTEHMDGYYEYPSARKWSTENNKFIKFFGSDDCDFLKKVRKEQDRGEGYGWVKLALGSSGENWDYTRKEKDVRWWEFGEPAEQGVRKDLLQYKRDIMERTMTVDDITVQDPMTYHQYGRTLNALEDIALRRTHRGGRFMTKGIWYYGSTGCGKSHRAFHNEKGEPLKQDEYYNVPKDGRWWDGYKQQDIVIINEFRGHIPYDDMLAMVDKWDYEVSRRGREPMPFVSKLVIVTSSKTPEQVYCNRDEEDSIQQLLRRFQVIRCDEGSSRPVVENSTTVWSGNIRADPVAEHSSTKMQVNIGDNW